MELILERIRQLPPYQQLLADLPEPKEHNGLGLPRAARLPVLAALQIDLQRPTLFVTDRADHALSLFDELGFWTQSPRYLFSEPNPLFYEQAAWSANTRRERLQALSALAAYQLPLVQKPSVPPILISSARALMTRTLARRDFLKACKKISAGQSAQPEALLRAWDAIGYQRVNTVLEQGQFSRRGGIVDIWPPAEKLPYRLDFFGDEVESIRRFDPASQRTVEQPESILITPARELIVPAAGATADPRIADREVSEFDIPLLNPQPSSLLDFLPARSLVVVDDLSTVESMAAEIEEQAVRLRKESVAEGTLSPDGQTLKDAAGSYLRVTIVPRMGPAFGDFTVGLKRMAVRYEGNTVVDAIASMHVSSPEGEKDVTARVNYPLKVQGKSFGDGIGSELSGFQRQQHSRRIQRIEKPERIPHQHPAVSRYARRTIRIVARDEVPGDPLGPLNPFLHGGTALDLLVVGPLVVRATPLEQVIERRDDADADRVVVLRDVPEPSVPP